MRLWSTLVPLLALLGCATAPQAQTPPMTMPAAPVGLTLTAPVVAAADGRQIGSVDLAEGPVGVLITLHFEAGALTPGWHGAHFHQHGTCADQSAGFVASGPHVRHGATGVHGLLNPDGPEEGDLPSVYVPAEGPAEAQMFSTFVTLAGVDVGTRMPLLDADGAALVIHAAADDHMSQPIGGAGARVACAAFTPPGS